jgi:hypothetical protein
MATVAHILGLFVLVALATLALACLVIGLPGTFFLFAIALAYAWITGFEMVTWGTLAWLLALAVVGEVLELASAAAGTGGERPSRRVAVSALLGGVVGGLVGTPFLLGVGSLLGALAGAFTGAALAASSEGKETPSALRSGMTALRGRLLGFVVKASIGVVMLIVLVAAAI